MGSHAAQPFQRSEEVPELDSINLALDPTWTQGTVSCRLNSISPFYMVANFRLSLIGHPLYSQVLN